MLSLSAKACRKAHVLYPLSITTSLLRHYSTPSPKPDPRTTPTDKWNYNKSSLYDPTPKDIRSFRWINGQELEMRKTPPRRVKMLVRDYIEDSLYNPNYGYFSKNATIFGDRTKPIDFNALRDSAEFTSEVGKSYAEYRHDTQLWHTPTELFRPWYARAVARCLVSEYLLKYFPYEDFHIYEIGAGNGTLALDVLNFIKHEYPDVYERTRYTIIEISGKLAGMQRKRLSRVHDCVEVVHKSIFHWQTRQPAPCFFIAMEVVDNFAHDLIRYDLKTLEPYQGVVSVDEEGDFDMHYVKVSDPLILSFLDLRRKLGHPLPISRAFQSSDFLRKLYSSMPFAANLSADEYIPTRLLSLVRTLRNNFPRHRLLLSDFSTLPDSISGVNAPVVQTRYQNNTIPTSNLLVQPGAFDIFFPTNFERLRDIYEETLAQPVGLADCDVHAFAARPNPLTPHGAMSFGKGFFSSYQPSNRRKPVDGVNSASGLPVGERKSNVFTHAEFLETYADLDRTRLRNGENPMVDFYRNVKVLF